ncbi:MAG TPA: hypothetical protein VJ464_13675 [Blastocatellia bacterium]|nr:hypothetical protein [Blastocatellia bacterium]
MNEPALLQFGNGALSIVAAIFVLGANQKASVRRVRWWLALAILLGAAMYLAQFAFALNNPSAGLTRDQVYISLAFNLSSTFCMGIAVLSHYMRRRLRERTSAVVLVLVLAATAAFDLVFTGWYASSAVNFLLFGVLAWSVRNEDIASSMVFLAYACLQVPRKLGSAGHLEFDFGLLVVSKFALIGAIYKTLDALQARETESTAQDGTTA